MICISKVASTFLKKKNNKYQLKSPRFITLFIRVRQYNNFKQIKKVNSFQVNKIKLNSKYNNNCAYLKVKQMNILNFKSYINKGNLKLIHKKYQIKSKNDIIYSKERILMYIITYYSIFSLETFVCTKCFIL